MLHHFITFASDAELVGLWGALFLAFALFAMVMERRRGKRARIDRVGWVPWLGLAVGSATIGGGLLSLAIKGILAG